MQTDEQYYFDLLDKLFPKAVYTKDAIEITIEDGDMKNLMDLIIGAGKDWFNKNVRLKLNMDLYFKQVNFNSAWSMGERASLEVSMMSKAGTEITLKGRV